MKNNPKPAVLDASDVLVELREQTKWLRFLGLRALAPVLEQQLKSDRERLAYELSDGRSSEAIGPLAGVSSRSILNWWAKWLSAGIAIDAGRGRVQRLASLTQLGISVPAKVAQAAKATDPDLTDEEAANGKSDE
jgi:hypothetical protein